MCSGDIVCLPLGFLGGGGDLAVLHPPFHPTHTAGRDRLALVAPRSDSGQVLQSAVHDISISWRVTSSSTEQLAQGRDACASVATLSPSLLHVHRREERD